VEPKATVLVEGLPQQPKMDSYIVEEKTVPGEALGDHSDVVTEPGDNHEDGDRAEAFPIAETEQPDLEAESTRGGQVEPQVTEDLRGPLIERGSSDDHGEVLDPRAVVSHLARVSPGPHHHVGEWTLGLCPACGKRTVAWRFHPPEVVSICGCPVTPGLVRADRLPVEPVTIR
jgi:hypothetical protein